METTDKLAQHLKELTEMQSQWLKVADEAASVVWINPISGMPESSSGTSAAKTRTHTITRAGFGLLPVKTGYIDGNEELRTYIHHIKQSAIKMQKLKEDGNIDGYIAELNYLMGFIEGVQV